MQKFFEDLLELAREHRQQGEDIDFSVDLLRRLDPVEREEFIRRMIEESVPAETPAEAREKMAQIYLSLVESDDPASLMEQLEKESGLE